MIEQLIPFLFIGVVLLIVGFGMFYSHFAAGKRRAALEELAGEMGLSWFESGTLEQISHHTGFNLFNQGRARKVNNVIEGVTDEVRICIFDYQFTTGSGKNQRTTKQTVASLSSSQLSCPEFSMRPEGIFDRVGGLLGFQDIDFDSHPDFSKSFVLKGPNEERIRAFFQPPVLEFFETQAGISVEGIGDSICLYRTGKTVSPEEIKDLLADTYRVFGCLVDA
jgi:hypothetical protein